MIEAKDFEEKYNLEFINQIEVSEFLEIGTFRAEIRGHKVIGASLISGEASETEVTAEGAIRFSICSEEDRYDEETGLSIAIGRVVAADIFDYSVTVPAGNMDKQVKTIYNMIGEKLKDLDKYLQKRDTMVKEHRTREQDMHKELAQKFEGFK